MTNRTIGRQRATWLLLGFEWGLLVAVLYQLCLLLAAVVRKSNVADEWAPSLDAGQSGTMRFLILVPAHNEAAGIETTLATLRAIEYPAQQVRTVVIADNCNDDTAARARTAGAEVLIRDVSAKRGKGYALAWALQRLVDHRSDFDAVVMIDADCIPSRNLLIAMERRFNSGARAVQAPCVVEGDRGRSRSGTEALQVPYVVRDPLSSRATGLRFAAFALLHTIRPLGKEQLGLSAGLWGTGMAFTRELLQRVPWTAASLTEDAEYHLCLVESDERVAFVSDASVSTRMPTSLKASGDQRARWERGKLELVRRWSPRLVKAGLSHRDLVRLHAGLEPLVPPQSLIAAGTLGCGLLGGLLRSRRAVMLSVVTLAGQLAFVLGGLAIVRAPREVYRALLSAPELMVRQISLYLTLLTGRGPDAWVSAPREQQAETER